MKTKGVRGFGKTPSVAAARELSRGLDVKTKLCGIWTKSAGEQGEGRVTCDIE